MRTPGPAVPTLSEPPTPGTLTPPVGSEVVAGSFPSTSAGTVKLPAEVLAMQLKLELLKLPVDKLMLLLPPEIVVLVLGSPPVQVTFSPGSDRQLLCSRD